MVDWAKAEEQLKAPLRADAIKPPPKGKFGEYVDGLHVISEANRIFGHNGWSYEVTRLEEVSSITADLNGNNGPYQQYRCGWMCTVRVTVDGVIREGAAVGMGSGKPESMADVIESAVKEAETDALKRALRTFGNTFGLALYEKDKEKRQVEQPKTIKDKIEEASSADDINGLMQEAAKFGDQAKRHLMARASVIGLTFDQVQKKFVEE